ncbi:ATP-binding protein [Zhongshania sp.]|uniref:ATP-binding protein n=1 Tax=Zhongshania sp. TaxID=1971902 RepID=UPI0035631AEB
MSILQQISKPADRPIIATLLGDSGMGKTTLACTFPSPIVMRVEDGLQAIPAEHRPDALPTIVGVNDVWDQLTALINEEHQYQTLVVDSVTALERLFIQHVIDSDPKKPKSINQANGGYGAGLGAVATLHQRVRRAAGILNDKGMHVVFIAHADTETIELPDSDPYTRYTLRLGKKSTAPYVDDSDLVGFLRLVTYTHGDGERKKAISDGSRELVCNASASNVSKNRFGITEPLPVELGINPLTGVVSCL